MPSFKNTGQGISALFICGCNIHPFLKFGKRKLQEILKQKGRSLLDVNAWVDAIKEEIRVSSYQKEINVGYATLRSGHSCVRLFSRREKSHEIKKELESLFL
jgi:hypothetical protein